MPNDHATARALISMQLAQRMQHIAAFEVMEVQTVARELEAQGADIIHLEIGEPDFRTPQPINDALVHALNTQSMFYTSALGITPLREAIAQFYEDKYGVRVPSSRIIVTAGSSAALLLALGVLVNAGDTVAMGDPSYPCNRHFVRAIEAVPQLIPTSAETAFQLTADILRANWRDNTRAVIIASPANPTGTTVAQSEWAKLAALCRERGATLIADEIYQGLAYDGPPHSALAQADDVFVINSFSKYFQMTGWRLGWLVVPERYTREVEKLAQNLFICASTPAQHAALAAFRPETRAIIDLRVAELKARRDFLLDALPGIGFRITARPSGAFYIYADVSSITNDSYALAQRIIREAHVAVTPGKDFGFAAPEHYIRIAYTQPIERLREAVDRIRKLLA